LTAAAYITAVPVEVGIAAYYDVFWLLVVGQLLVDEFEFDGMYSP
jgi:hypothetical protein